jgi:hypothetical protein
MTEERSLEDGGGRVVAQYLHDCSMFHLGCVGRHDRYCVAASDAQFPQRSCEAPVPCGANSCQLGESNHTADEWLGTTERCIQIIEYFQIFEPRRDGHLLMSKGIQSPFRFPR